MLCFCALRFVHFIRNPRCTEVERVIGGSAGLVPSKSPHHCESSARPVPWSARRRVVTGKTHKSPKFLPPFPRRAIPPGRPAGPERVRLARRLSCCGRQPAAPVTSDARRRPGRTVRNSFLGVSACRGACRASVVGRGRREMCARAAPPRLKNHSLLLTVYPVCTPAPPRLPHIQRKHAGVAHARPPLP